MNITVEIKAPELVEAIKLLAVSLSGSKLEPVKVAPAVEEPKKEKTKPVKKEEVKQPDPEPVADPEPVKEEEPAQEEPENIPSVVELRAAAQEKGKTPEGKKAIKALLDQFGSKSISDVSESSRAAFLAALEEI